jgi:hypothetical protein
MAYVIIYPLHLSIQFCVDIMFIKEESEKKAFVLLIMVIIKIKMKIDNDLYVIVK